MSEVLSARAGQMVSSPRQEAILVWDRDTIQVTLRTSFRKGPEELAWVIPIPREPESVQEADSAIFADLEAVTAPTFVRFVAHRGLGFGCSADRAPESTGQVAVMKTGQAGIYDYTVLSASGTTAIIRWLTDHGYPVPYGAEAVFRHYVDRGFCWLAIQLNAQHANEPVLAANPIRYTYHDTQLVYPLVISQLSADAKNEILLYILSDGYYVADNWEIAIFPLGRLMLQSGTSSGTNYEQLFDSLTERANGHLFVTEYVGDLEYRNEDELLNKLTGHDLASETYGNANIRYLTRLRAVIPRNALDRDVNLVPADAITIDSVYYFMDEPSSISLTSIVLMFCLAALVTILRRVRRIGHTRRDND